jgi:hypothetical protein
MLPMRPTNTARDVLTSALQQNRTRYYENVYTLHRDSDRLALTVQSGKHTARIPVLPGVGDDSVAVRRLARFPGRKQIGTLKVRYTVTHVETT